MDLFKLAETYARNIIRKSVPEAEVEEMIDHCKISSAVVDDSCVVAVLKTHEGFVVSNAVSAPVSTNLFDPNKAKEAARKQILSGAKKELWRLEGYALHCRIMWYAETILRVAKAAHEVNRIYCQSLGDSSQPSWETAPQWQLECSVKQVAFHMINPGAGPEASHESRYAEKEADGWVYGDVKDPSKKQHPCMVAYKDLPEEQRRKDEYFCAVVKSFLPEESEY